MKRLALAVLAAVAPVVTGVTLARQASVQEDAQVAPRSQSALPALAHERAQHPDKLPVETPPHPVHLPRPGRILVAIVLPAVAAPILSRPSTVAARAPPRA